MAEKQAGRLEALQAEIAAAIAEADDPAVMVNDIRRAMFEVSMFNAAPVDFVKWVPLEQIQPNDYNPNVVAKVEMKLLYISILHDGYTQPVVVFYNTDKGVYEIIDGFHRYSVMRFNQDIYDLYAGYLPCVVLHSESNDRMASTIRHNRARGKHQVTGMSDIVFNMLENGWSDAEICNELGMEPEELVKLKHVTGFSKLFENVEYRRAWEVNNQLKLRKEWQDSEDKAD